MILFWIWSKLCLGWQYTRKCHWIIFRIWLKFVGGTLHSISHSFRSDHVFFVMIIPVQQMFSCVSQMFRWWSPISWIEFYPLLKNDAFSDHAMQKHSYCLTTLLILQHLPIFLQFLLISLRYLPTLLDTWSAWFQHDSDSFQFLPEYG